MSSAASWVSDDDDGDDGILGRVSEVGACRQFNQSETCRHLCVATSDAHIIIVYHSFYYYSY